MRARMLSAERAVRPRTEAILSSFAVTTSMRFTERSISGPEAVFSKASAE